MDKYPNLHADIAPGFEKHFVRASDGRLPAN